MAGDKPKQPVYEMFGIKLWFQQSKSRLPRLKEACECASQRWLGKGKGAMPQLGCRQGAHLPYLGLWAHHRLNGSSSPVLTATSLSYGKVKNSTPHRIKTPDLTEIKFGTVDYVGEMTPHAKFHVNPSKGGFPANGWNIRKNFYSYIPFFQKLIYRSDPLADFYVQWLKRRSLVQGCAFWELKNVKLIFNVFIRKNRKNYNGAYGEN